MSTKPEPSARRAYDRSHRDEAAAETRARVLASAKAQFSARGIDAVTIAELAEAAGVSASTVYALFKSKEGVLLAVIEGALFGARFRAAAARLDAIADPVEQVAMTPTVARAIYESERAELGLMRGASAFSPALRRTEQRFEETRYAMQESRLKALFASGRAKAGVSLEEARRLMWMYTSRDVYRMLVHEGGWTPDHFESWLSRTLLDALVDPGATGLPKSPDRT